MKPLKDIGQERYVSAHCLDAENLIARKSDARFRNVVGSQGMPIKEVKVNIYLNEERREFAKRCFAAGVDSRASAHVGSKDFIEREGL